MKPTNVRWTMAAGLAAFALCSYLTRSNISVAAEAMIPALGITHIQMGQIFSGFLWGYALFQIPGGILGDRSGPRRTLAFSAVVWGAASILTGLASTLAFGNAVATFALLSTFRFLLGIAQATTFPVGNRVVRNWFASSERALGGSIMFMGTSTASAITGAVMPALVARYGWQKTFYLSAVPPVALAALWYWWSRDTPAEHAHVNAAECALVQAHDTPEAAEPGPAVSLRSLLAKRNIMLLTLSYVSEGYVLFIFVFWLYIYLVEHRHFSAVRGGWAAALPWIAAVLLTPIGGRVSDLLTRRQGRLEGSRTVLATSYGVTGLTLFLAAYAHSAMLSVAALSASIAFLMASETSFWAAAAHLAGEQVGAVSGIMNTAGILGGILSTSLVPVLVQYFGWISALASGTVISFFCVAIWFFIGEEAAVDTVTLSSAYSQSNEGTYASNNG